MALVAFDLDGIKFMSRPVQSGDLHAPHLPRALRLSRKATMAAAAFGLLTVLSGCNDVQDGRAMQALSDQTMAALKEKGVSPQAPMLIRAYKKESELEVWKMRADGTYVFVRTFPICRWSGQLGPKTHEGDRQSPEGFYSITPGMMNPHSSYYLSFNIGYPNAYDRSHGATGGLVMVHGVCSSAGCFSMTDAQIAEIYALARESFAGGQRAIQMQSYPFHMTTQNLAKYRLDPNMPFWKELRKGNDHFEATRHDVSVAVCGRHYVFDAKSANGQPLEADAACPPLKVDQEIEAKADARAHADDAAIAQLVAKGTRPVRLVYQDGAQHPIFAHRFADVSRPDALVPPVELALDDSNARYNAKARTASTATAIILAQAQALQEAEAQQKAQRSRAQAGRGGPIGERTHGRGAGAGRKACSHDRLLQPSGRQAGNRGDGACRRCAPGRRRWPSSPRRGRPRRRGPTQSHPRRPSSRRSAWPRRRPANPQPRPWSKSRRPRCPPRRHWRAPGELLADAELFSGICARSLQAAHEQKGHPSSRTDGLCFSFAIGRRAKTFEPATGGSVLFVRPSLAVHAGDEGRRGLEGHDAAGDDLGLDAGARIAADALALGADVEGAESAQLHRFLAQHGVDDFLERHLEHVAGLCARQRRTGVVDRIEQFRPRRGLALDGGGLRPAAASGGKPAAPSGKFKAGFLN